MAEVYDPNLTALSHSIQSTWPFGVTEPADSDEIYLKAHLSNNVYTLIKATKFTTVQEAIAMVAKNKQVRLDGFKVKIVTPVSQVDVTDLSRPLSDFHHPIGLILYNPAGSVVAENKPLLRGGRRASVVVAPKETHIRMASREFPKTVLDQAEATFTTGLGKGEFTTIPKPVRRRSRFSLKMFRRERDISDDSASDTDSNKSGDNGSHEYTTSRLSSSKSASIPRYLDENTPSRLPEAKSFSVPRYLDETPESPTSSSDAASSPTTWSPPVVDADGEIPYFNSNSDQSSMIRSETTSSIPESPLPDPDADVPSSFRKPSMIRSDTTSSIPESPLPDPDADVPSSFRKSDRTSMIRSETTSSIPDSPLPDPDADVPSSFRKPDRTSMIRSETTSSILNPPRSDSDAEESSSFHFNSKPRPPLLRSETTTSIATLNRKRTTSSPTVPMNGNATLRRNTFRTRSRTQSEAPMPSNLEAAGISTVSVRVTYPNGSVSAYKMPQNITMESILKFSCTAQGNMDLEKYTFEALDQKFPIEMDRNLYFYVEKKVTSFVIVEREKEFSLKWVAEGDQDTMVLQIVGGEWLVMAATEQKLIERMTDGEIKTDLNFIDTLLLTYRSFTTPAKFFDELVCRFNAELPPDPSPEDVEYFEKMKGPSQEKVMTVFSWWIQYHIQDFTHNDEMRQELKQVLQEISEYPWFEKRAQEMNHMVDVKTKEYETLYGHILPSQVERKGKTMDSSLIQNLTAEELAQQLCIHDFDLFRNIPAIEYLNQIWRRPNDDEMLTCPSLDYFIARFDKVSYWLASEVCCVKDKKKRIQVLEKFIMTAKLCQTYGNFFTMFALIAGLSLNSVSRLKKTFDGLSKTAKATVEELEKLADPSRNMKNYRDCVSTTKPPIVPFLPIYLKDLTFINDGNESKIFNNMINFDKLRMMARRVHDITDMTKVEYKFPPQPIIQNYLNKPPAERDSQKLKEMSLKCEQKK